MQVAAEQKTPVQGEAQQQLAEKDQGKQPPGPEPGGNGRVPVRQPPRHPGRPEAGQKYLGQAPAGREALQHKEARRQSPGRGQNAGGQSQGRQLRARAAFPAGIARPRPLAQQRQGGQGGEQGHAQKNGGQSVPGLVHELAYLDELACGPDPAGSQQGQDQQQDPAHPGLASPGQQGQQNAAQGQGGQAGPPEVRTGQQQRQGCGQGTKTGACGHGHLGQLLD